MADSDQTEVERKKNDQGLHECEVFQGNQCEDMEAGTSWAACTKNPGHPDFIPYPEFKVYHLPQGWQTKEVFSQVTELAERTVKLRIGYTSPGRPDGYAFCNMRGSSVVHTGTGWMEHVRPRTDQACPCPDCTASISPHPGVWYQVDVVTACHVVYNAEEARATKVDFYFDEKTSRRDGKMQTIQAYDLLKNDAVEDACVLVCAAHDLGNIQLGFPMEMSVLPTPMLKVTPDDPCVVVSHPHGRPKQITIGRVKGADPSRPEALITYDASTCPGCSGAPVLAFYLEGSRTVNQSSVHSRGNVTEGANQGSCIFVKLE